MKLSVYINFAMYKAQIMVSLIISSHLVDSMYENFHAKVNK